MEKNYVKALLELRSVLNVSQAEMADILSVSYPSVNRRENGRAIPVKIVRIRIEKLYKENNIVIEEK